MDLTHLPLWFVVCLHSLFPLRTFSGSVSSPGSRTRIILEGPQIPAKCSCEHTNMLPFSLVTNSKAVWFNSSDKRSTLSSMVGDCISYRSAYGSNRYWAAVPCLYAGQDRRSMGPPETIGDRKISCSVRSITESNCTLRRETVCQW